MSITIALTGNPNSGKTTLFTPRQVQTSLWGTGRALHAPEQITHIDDNITQRELKNLLGDGDVTVTVSLPESA